MSSLLRVLLARRPLLFLASRLRCPTGETQCLLGEVTRDTATERRGYSRLGDGHLGCLGRHASNVSGRDKLTAASPPDGGQDARQPRRFHTARIRPLAKQGCPNLRMRKQKRGRISAAPFSDFNRISNY